MKETFYTLLLQNSYHDTRHYAIGADAGRIKGLLASGRAKMTILFGCLRGFAAQATEINVVCRRISGKNLAA